MYRIICIILSGMLFINCTSTGKNEDDNSQPLMYQPTEMALLMRKMYEVNRALKWQIITNDTWLSYPEEFSTIHTAVLTDPSERNAEFDSLAKVYLEYQKAAFSVRTDSIIYNYNQSINTCIACHETRCVGPIPKIKKLLIR